MSTAKHTPGPWISHHTWTYQAIKAPSVVAQRGGPKTIAVVYNYGPSPEADARLIAAAPDLLGALQALDDYVCNNLSSDYPTGVDVDHDAFKAARAAIAKAKGEQA